MAIYAEQLSSGKWGIYSTAGTDSNENKAPNLIATVACETTCATIMANLKSGRRDIPDSDLSQLYELPKLTNQLSQPKSIKQQISNQKALKRSISATARQKNKGESESSLKTRPLKNRKRTPKSKTKTAVISQTITQLAKPSLERA